MSDVSSTVLRAIATACIALAAAMLTPAGARLPVAPRPTLGHRGAMRRRALSTPFAWIEPAVRVVAGPLARLPLGSARASLEALVVRSGRHLGLDADDALALVLVSAMGFATGTTLLVHHATLPATWIVAAAALGAAMPLVALHERAKLRARLVSRALPATIDLAALCMGAGLDFAGALRLLAREGTNADEPLVEELELVLAALATGHTRREALDAFATRVPAPAVRDFVHAVVQAEQKGTPLVDVLQIQAQGLRARRSAAGEEAAARASVWLALPLLLLLCAVLLLMMGPFLVADTGLS